MADKEHDHSIRMRKKSPRKNSTALESEGIAKSSINHSNIIEKIVDKCFGNFSEKCKTFVVRTILTLILLIWLPILIFGGFTVDFINITIIVFQCYNEYIRVGYQQHMGHSLPLIRSLAWYILLSVYFLTLGDMPINYFASQLGYDMHAFLITHHSFVGFMLFILGTIIFVTTLKKHYYKMQFYLYAWFLIGSLFLSLSAYCLFKNMMQGIIWVFLPMGLIVVNDIFAYVCGILFGRTPLIKISPKKTWEGFIGSGIVTIISSFLLCKLLTISPYFYCPYEFSFGSHSYGVNCKLPRFMETKVYELAPILKIITLNQFPFIYYNPIDIHMFIISIFISLIAPFGGFLASGFKRAFKIKDFGDTFPGHGGMLDRMDCQFLVTSFVYVYINTFIKFGEPQKILSQIIKLMPEDQLELYVLFKNYLSEQALLI